MRRKLACAALALMMAVGLLLGGCDSGVRLDPKNPEVLTLWHYYSGTQKAAFDDLVLEFNSTVGMDTGIVIEANSYGGVNELAESVLAAAREEAGASTMPDLFTLYADSAYILHQMGKLADLTTYISQEDLDEYIPSYIEEGRLLPDGQLCIFPFAKSTEVLMLNLTDWQPFEDAMRLLPEYENFSKDILRGYEGIYEAARLYYEWCGKSLFGIDSVANFIYIGSKQMGSEIQSIENGKPFVRLDENALRPIYDFYYGGILRGYVGEYGRFRSDDAKTGDILAFTGSTTGGRYFPLTVTQEDGQEHDIEMLALPMPLFAGGPSIAVQQGAGICVAKSDEKKEYAASVFLQWFTQTERNTLFSVMSGGYLPVKAAALSGEEMQNQINQMQASGDAGDQNVAKVLTCAVEQVGTYTLYTSPAFEGSMTIRYALDDLSTVAQEARQALLADVQAGMPMQEALDKYHNDETFAAWLTSVRAVADEAMAGE